MTVAIDTGVAVHRRTLVKALEKINRVLLNRTYKPILKCVRIESSDGQLWLSGTDLETSLTVHVPAEGELPRCLVQCQDLLKRVKAGQVPNCELVLSGNTLIANGGNVEHRLSTLPHEEYPAIPVIPEGRIITLQAGKLREALNVALTGAATASTRYAVTGVLLEVKDGVRLVSTDGRRLVTVELDCTEKPAEELSAILPAKLCKMIRLLVEADDEQAINIFLKPNTNEDGSKAQSNVYVVGLGWLLHALELEGNFPAWRDVMPQGGSKFLLDRKEMLKTVDEVSLACGSTRSGVYLRLADQYCEVSARSDNGGVASGKVTCRYLGGGDNLILTAVDAGFLGDALKVIDGEQVVIGVDQNTLGSDGKVYHRPLQVFNWATRRIRWVIMPIAGGIAPSRESLGSNFREKAGG